MIPFDDVIMAMMLFVLASRTDEAHAIISRHLWKKAVTQREWADVWSARLWKHAIDDFDDMRLRHRSLS